MYDALNIILFICLQYSIALAFQKQDNFDSPYPFKLIYFKSLFVQKCLIAYKYKW